MINFPNGQPLVGDSSRDLKKVDTCSERVIKSEGRGGNSSLDNIGGQFQTGRSNQAWCRARISTGVRRISDNATFSESIVVES